MYAQKKQIGGHLTCPDCGVKTLVKRPPPEPTRASPLVEGYDLDEASAPGPGPKIVPAVIQRLAAEAEAEVKEKEGQPKQPDAVSNSSRPRMPLVPLVQGVLSMLFCEAIVVRWIILSVSLTIVLWLLSFSLLPISSQYQFIALAGLVFGSLWAMGTAAILIAVLTESSEGNNRLHNPPALIFYEWFGDLFYVVIASAMAGVPFGVIAVPLAKLLPWDLGLWLPGSAAIGGWLFCFPIMLLSMLEQGSPAAIFSPKLVRSLWRQPWAWLLFYAESTLLIAVCATSLVAAVMLTPLLGLLATPIVVAMSLVYFRLLGRLAWWLAERGAS